MSEASGDFPPNTLQTLDTPTVKGVWETPPYLHDGSAPTLMHVITTRNPGDRHGSTSHLTTAEKAQLVAYLRPLDDSPQKPARDGTLTVLARTTDLAQG